MLGSVARTRIEVSLVGFVARRALSSPGGCKVTAVFKAGFYVAAQESSVFVTAAPANAGPLTLLCGPASNTDWQRSPIDAGTACRVENGRLEVGGRFIFLFAAANTWMPPAAEAFSPKSLATALRDLNMAAKGQVPQDGLGGLAFPSAHGVGNIDVTERAREPISRLGTWLVAGLSGPSMPEAAPPDLSGLIGLGPGLTPSGDDFLGGALIALNALGRADLAKALYASVREDMALHSNAISATLLGAAAEGAGNGHLHDCLEALLGHGDKDIGACLPGISAFGHTSGWDALAGMAMTLRWFLTAQQRD